MHIVFLNPIGQLGGAETSLIELVAGLRRYQSDWRLSAIIGAVGPLGSRLRDLGVNVIEQPMPSVLASVGESLRSKTVLRGSRNAAVALLYGRALRRTLNVLRPD